ncbi:MAG TPA: peptidylprolyl isomerase [Longimicrobiales bacterium]|nr:peptidylprolyl isomerase [Longimicrobiales bacterium]
MHLPLRLVPALLLVAAACGGSGSRGEANPVLLQPGDTMFDVQAPDKFRARFTTTEGEFTIEVYRDWAPRGADRFFNLVRSGYYDGTRFFRVVPGFMAQFGLHGDPEIEQAWRAESLQDDPVVQSNRRGTIAFAMAGPDTRSTQVFINYRDNEALDGAGFAPFGRVVDGMMIVDRLNGAYGELAPEGRGPDERRLAMEGEEYLRREFADLDRIERAEIVEPGN